MAYTLLDRSLAREAFRRLDGEIEREAELVVGRGAAMVLAYNHPLATQDVDAFAKRGSVRVSELDAAARRVAKNMNLAPDWLNAHFETFAHVLPRDYGDRLRPVFSGTRLSVSALGPEDLLVMKCFAGRDKDLLHARKLIHLCDDLDVVDAQLAYLLERRIPHADAAADFFDDLRDAESL